MAADTRHLAAAVEAAAADIPRPLTVAAVEVVVMTAAGNPRPKAAAEAAAVGSIPLPVAAGAAVANPTYPSSYPCSKLRNTHACIASA